MRPIGPLMVGDSEPSREGRPGSATIRKPGPVGSGGRPNGFPAPPPQPRRTAREACPVEGSELQALQRGAGRSGKTFRVDLNVVPMKVVNSQQTNTNVVNNHVSPTKI